MWYFLIWRDICIEQKSQWTSPPTRNFSPLWYNVLDKCLPLYASSSSAIYFSVVCIFLSSFPPSSSTAHFQAGFVSTATCKFPHLRHSQINHRHAHYKQETLMSSLRLSVICALINWLFHLILDYIKYPKVIILILYLTSCNNLIFNRIWNANDVVAN